MSYSSEVLADSPLGYWRLGEESGNPADSSPNARHVTNIFGAGTILYNQPSALLSDPANRSIFFDGRELSVPDDNGLDLISTLTIEAWLRRSAVGAQHPILAKGTGAYNFDIGTNNRLRLTKQDVVNLAESTATIPADGSWRHVVVVRDGTTVRFYINGQLDSETTGVTTNFDATTVSLRIAGDSNGVHWMNGTLDEVALYSTALSAARIQAHYQAALKEDPPLRLARSVLRW